MILFILFFICVVISNDYYQTLELTKQSTQEEIKESYERMKKQYENDDEKLKEIQEAYEILSNEVFKVIYDNDDLFTPIYIKNNEN